MVKNSKISATTLGRNGIQDWLILRASAIVITLYVLYLVGFVAFTSDITYDVWYSFFTASFTQVFTTQTLIAILAHAWVGLWQVRQVPEPAPAAAIYYHYCAGSLCHLRFNHCVGCLNELTCQRV